MEGFFSRDSIPWKAYINHLLRDYGEIFLLRCNYDIKEYKINSTFYDELLHWWADFREDFSTKPSTSKSVIWNNKLIKIDDKSIYYHNYVKAGIIFCNQMQFDKNNLESYNSTKCKGLIHSIFFKLVRDSKSPVQLKTLNVEETQINSLKFQCGEKIFDPVRCKSKQFYELLISKKTMNSRGFTKLKENFDLNDITVSKAFLNLKTVSSETFIRSFQFKFLDDTIYTNV